MHWGSSGPTLSAGARAPSPSLAPAANNQAAPGAPEPATETNAQHDHTLWSTYAPIEAYGNARSPIPVPASSGIPKSMREFIITMAGKSPDEMSDAAGNIRLTRTHFTEAEKKVKASLDDEALEAAERQAWEMLYSGDQREILNAAMGAIHRAELRKEHGQDTRDLKALVFARTKDWNEIKRCTHRLEEELKPVK